MKLSFRSLLLMFTVLSTWAANARLLDVEGRANADKAPIPKAVADALDRLKICAEKAFPNDFIKHGALYEDFSHPELKLEIRALCFEKAKILVGELSSELDAILNRELRAKVKENRRSMASIPEPGFILKPSPQTEDGAR